MAKKKKAAEVAATEAAPAVEGEGLDVQAAEVHPDTHIGIDHAGSGDYAYYGYDNTNRDRTVHFAGKTYEHVAEDAAGCWLYRHLG